jgi:gamma-tubulin complex component 3
VKDLSDCIDISSTSSFFDTILDYDTIGDLEEVISIAAEKVNKRLLEVFFSKYSFLSHCQSIKRYLLLGQGDFIQQLMSLLGEELSKPISALYRHNLISILESAIQRSNAQYHQTDFVHRLDVKLLDPSEFSNLVGGPKGWDLFLLDYHVDPPINAVFSQLVMDQYLRIFNFLFGLQKAQCDLARYVLSLPVSVFSLLLLLLLPLFSS